MVGAPTGGVAPPAVERMSRGVDLEALRSGYTPEAEERSIEGYGLDDGGFPPPPADGYPNGHGARTAREAAPEPAARSTGRLEELPAGERWRTE